MSRHQNKRIDITNINDFDDDGLTPLMRIIEDNRTDNLEEAIKLVNKGADINIQTEDTETELLGDSALSLAIKNGNYKMVKFLIDKGSNKEHSVRSQFFDNGDYKTGNLIEKIETIIEIAMRCGDNDIINILKK